MARLIIKKYANRRLYCVDAKKFVTLEEIAKLISDGAEVRILDAETDEDITKLLLIQIILESEENKSMQYPLSKSFLHLLIKQGYSMAVEFVESYMLVMFQPYLSVGENMRKNLLGLEVSDWMSSVMKPQFPSKFIDPFEFFLNPKPQEKHRVEEKSSVLPLLMELDRLREKVSELEEQITVLSNPKQDKSDPPPKPQKTRKR